MPSVSPSLSVVFGVCVLGLSGLSSAACKRQPPPPAVESPPASAAAAVVAPPPPSVCRRVAELGLAVDAELPPKSPPQEVSDEDEEADDLALPFGVELGAAVPTSSGFAVAGLRGGNQVFVALLSAGDSRRVDVAELHGEPELPALIAVGDEVLVALRSSDAAGFTIKLGRLQSARGDALEWGYELTKLGRSVSGVELAASGRRAALVYQADDTKGDPRLMLGTFSLDNPKAPFSAKPLESKDCEMPRLVARPGGYWLGWVRRLPEPKTAAKSAPDASSPADPEERELLEVGLRVVEVVKLDEQGKWLGTPVRIGQPRRQVLLYDMAALGSGSLLVTTRSDSAAPGAEGGAILLSEVGPDGSVHEERLDDGELDVGAPSLLVERDPALPGPWLTVSSASDVTRVGLARGERTTLQSDPLLGHAEVLAVGGGRLLVARARGRGVSLEALDCAFTRDLVPENR